MAEAGDEDAANKGSAGRDEAKCGMLGRRGINESI